MPLETEFKSFISEFEPGSLNVCTKNSIILNLIYSLAELQENEIEFNYDALLFIISNALTTKHTRLKLDSNLYLNHSTHFTNCLGYKHSFILLNACLTNTWN